MRGVSRIKVLESVDNERLVMIHFKPPLISLILINEISLETTNNTKKKRKKKI